MEPEQTEKKNYNTIFKSAYYLGPTLLNLYVNFEKSFSFLIKKGKYYFVYNLTEDEKLAFAKSIMRQLTPKERNEVIESCIDHK